jgi:hypothetical protein
MQNSKNGVRNMVRTDISENTGGLLGYTRQILDGEKKRKDIVYFIQSINGGNIKIGVSRNPIERLRELQPSCPDQLVILTMVKGGPEKESEFHERFVEHNVHHEWFRPAKEIVDYIIKDLEMKKGEIDRIISGLKFHGDG